jgi:DNA-binding XRE family transcriptional regulator
MIFLSQNLKHLRKSQKGKLTQEDLANTLGISHSTYGSYEEGRAEPKLETLQRIATFFKVALQDLLTIDLVTVSPLGSPSGSGARVLVATVEPSGRDTIEWVPEKATAGYAKGLANVDYIKSLETFRLPFLDERKKYRAFVVQGDSMPPISPGSILFGEYVENWSLMKDASLGIIITAQEGIVFKKIFNYLNDRGCFLLQSTNEAYKPYVVPADEILEVWQFVGFYSSEF